MDPQILERDSKRCIVYQKDGNGNETTRYVDLDRIGNLDDCKSLARCVFTQAGGAVS